MAETASGQKVGALQRNEAHTWTMPANGGLEIAGIFRKQVPSKRIRYTVAAGDGGPNDSNAHQNPVCQDLRQQTGQGDALATEGTEATPILRDSRQEAFEIGRKRAQAPQRSLGVPLAISPERHERRRRIELNDGVEQHQMGRWPGRTLDARQQRDGGHAAADAEEAGAVPPGHVGGAFQMVIGGADGGLQTETTRCAGVTGKGIGIEGETVPSKRPETMQLRQGRVADEGGNENHPPDRSAARVGQKGAPRQGAVWGAGSRP